MKTLFTAEAISKGGRSGTIETPETCPYSKALRGDTSVKLVVD
jgi:organic hydroperoxide reductase OsmC/OhrA